MFSACHKPQYFDVLIVVDGVWTDWQDWGACDSTCAYGHQMRVRNCTGPFHGGLECTGPAEEIQKCFAAECPSKNLFRTVIFIDFIKSLTKILFVEMPKVHISHSL